MSNFQKRYDNSPDVLDLVINLSKVEGVEVTQLETPFGADERNVATVDGSVIGILVEAEKYYEGFGVSLADRVVISLLPAARDLSGVELPSIEQLAETLQKVISNRNNEWLLVCERDCDQEPVPKLSADSEEAKSEIRNLFDFCKSGGACPTFMIETKR